MIPGSGRCPGGGLGDPLQYSGWDNPADRGAWQATWVAKTWTRRRGLASKHAECNKKALISGRQEGQSELEEDVLCSENRAARPFPAPQPSLPQGV